MPISFLNRRERYSGFRVHSPCNFGAADAAGQVLVDEAQNSVDLRPALRLPAALPRLGVIRREVHEFEKLGQRGAGRSIAS